MYLFVLAIGALGAGAYLLLFMSHIPGAVDERLGSLEPLPENMNKWSTDEELSKDGLLRETRHLKPESSSIFGPTLLRQVRYRHPTTKEIVRVEPETKVRRRRLRS